MLVKTRSVSAPSSAALAAVLFWAIYLGVAGLCLSAYWAREPRLVLTALLVLPFWGGSLAVWIWRIAEDDEKAVDRRMAEDNVRYYDRDSTAKAVRRERARLRMRRRRFVAIPLIVLLVIGTFVLWAVAIWQDHGHAFGITGAMLLGVAVPLVGATVEE